MCGQFCSYWMLFEQNMLNRLQLNKMGGTATKEQFPQSKHYSILDYGYCKVWKRTDTQKQTMEQYEIVIESQKMLQSYKRMWLLRAQEESVVGVYYFTHRANKDICGFYQNGSILTERIPYRLSQFSNVPYQEMLHILKIALNSYKMLHMEFGLFLIRSTMIGINSQKQIKLWHHTDYSAAEPENVHCRNMTEMIDSIIQSVEINAELPCYYPPFSDFIKANRGKIAPTFEDTLKALSSYIKMNRIPKCQNMPKLSNYLRQAEGWEELTLNSNFLTNLSNISQLNKSSYGKYSFRGNSDNNSSVSSSRKTLKNSPAAFNIYTQREVRQDYRSRDRSHLKSSKSQKIETLPQPQPYRYQYSPNLLDWQNHQNARLISDLRGKSIEKNNKIQIVISGKRMAVSPAPKTSTVSSIDRRIYQSPHHFNVSDYDSRQKESDFKATLPLRTNRFQQTASNFMQRRNDSMSPGVYYNRN